MVTNKKLGNKFEEELSQILFDHGFWVHRFQQNDAGQPADIIAVKNGTPYLIDCKVCSTRTGFRFRRVEDNQELAMFMWKSRGNGTGWFALKTQSGDICMLSFDDIYMLRKQKVAMKEDEIKSFCLTINEWIGFYERHGC